MQVETYARVEWMPEDVQSVKPEWDIEKCRIWLEKNEKHIRNRLTELGYEVIKTLADED